jgi:hypothetical protein
VLVATAFGMRFPLPIWLILLSGCAGLASNVLRPTRPKASNYLFFAMAPISIAAVIILLVTRP